MDVGWNARITECTNQNGVELAAQHGEAVGRNGNAVGEIARGSPVELVGFDGGARGQHYLHGFRDDVLPDAITGEDCNLLGGSHAAESIKGWKGLPLHRASAGSRLLCVVAPLRGLRSFLSLTQRLRAGLTLCRRFAAGAMPSRKSPQA